MPSSNLARWGGLAAAVGGVLLVIWGFLLILIFSPMGVLGPLYGLFIALWCLSWLLVLGGLVRLHARQANVYGRLGAAGFAIAFVGSLVVAALSFVYAEWPVPGPYAWGDGSGLGIAILVWEVGLLLVGIATLRAGALPLPWRALPLAIFLVFPFSIMLTPLMLVAGLESEFFYSGMPRILAGIGWILLGYALLSKTGESVRRPAPAR
jgi:hypothetical protein